MQSVKALRRWLVIVALLRLLAVFLGYFDHTKFKTNLFDDAPQEVTELCGRVFGIWTLLTCALCCICARNPCVPSIYGATLFSFVAALCFFLLELFVYQTVGWKSALQPLIVAALLLFLSRRRRVQSWNDTKFTSNVLSAVCSLLVLWAVNSNHTPI